MYKQSSKRLWVFDGNYGTSSAHKVNVDNPPPPHNARLMIETARPQQNTFSTLCLCGLELRDLITDQVYSVFSRHYHMCCRYPERSICHI